MSAAERWKGHTKGPFHIQPYPCPEAGVNLHGIWSRALGSPILVARTCFFPATEANARLIADAWMLPEMAEALADVVLLADAAMQQANSDGAEYDREDELAEARALLARLETGT